MTTEYGYKWVPFKDGRPIPSVTTRNLVWMATPFWVVALGVVGWAVYVGAI